MWRKQSILQNFNLIHLLPFQHVLYICGMLPWCQLEEAANLSQLITSTPAPKPASTTAPTLTPAPGLPLFLPLAPVPAPVYGPWAIHGPSPFPVPSTNLHLFLQLPLRLLLIFESFCPDARRRKQLSLFADWQKSAVVCSLVHWQFIHQTGKLSNSMLLTHSFLHYF